MTGFPMTIAFLGAVLAYILCGILPLRDIYREVEWPIIVLLGAMIPVSQAFQSTDCTGLIAESIKGLTGALPPWSMITLVMIVTMCLSDIINNAATAFIMAPIAVGISGTLGLQPDPFLMAVAVGASCAFLTPHRAPVQRHDIGAGWLPFRRLLAGWPAAGNRHSHPWHTTHRPILALCRNNPLD